MRNNKKSFVTLIDKNWAGNWKKKGKLKTDSETLKIKNNRIIELGKKTNIIKKIDGRYVGVTKVNKEILLKMREFYYKNLKIYPNKFLKIDMTSFFNLFIKKGYNLNFKQILKKWNEFDDATDLKTKYENTTILENIVFHNVKHIDEVIPIIL